MRLDGDGDLCSIAECNAKDAEEKKEFDELTYALRKTCAHEEVSFPSMKSYIMNLKAYLPHLMKGTA